MPVTCTFWSSTRLVPSQGYLNLKYTWETQATRRRVEFLLCKEPTGDESMLQSFPWFALISNIVFMPSQPQNTEFSESILTLTTTPWMCRGSPNFFIEYLTQNVIFHVKSHVNKHEFWGLLINTKIKTSHVTKLDMKLNMKWYIFQKIGWLGPTLSTYTIFNNAIFHF